MPAFEAVPASIATPFVPVAAIDSAPLEKLAVPEAPSAVLRLATKLAGVNAVAAPPYTLMVPAVKSMAITVFCTTPLLSVIATVDVPVKLLAAVVASRPVSRPVSEVGGGEAVEALLAAFSAWAVRETNSPSWSESPGSEVLRRSSRPRISPELTVIGVGVAVPPGVAAVR